jgi:hypothetical protein
MIFNVARAKIIVGFSDSCIELFRRSCGYLVRGQIGHELESAEACCYSKHNCEHRSIHHDELFPAYFYRATL